MGVVVDEIKKLFMQSDKVASRIIDGNAVLVDTEGGYVNVLNDVGSAIWDFIQTPRSFEEIADMTLSSFEYEGVDDVRSDIDAFLKEMEECHLIVVQSKDVSC